MYTVKCECGKEYRFDKSSIGKKFRCKVCDSKLVCCDNLKKKNENILPTPKTLAHKKPSKITKYWHPHIFTLIVGHSVAALFIWSGMNYLAEADLKYGETIYKFTSKISGHTACIIGFIIFATTQIAFHLQNIQEVLKHSSFLYGDEENYFNLDKKQNLLKFISLLDGSEDEDFED